MTAAPAGAGSGNGGPGQLDQRTLFRMVGNLYRVDPDLLEAIATVESRGNPNAVSPAGAEGLMQLMPATARRFGVEDPFDVVANVFGAARYLSHLRSWENARSGPAGSAAEVLAAYNAGQGAVEKYDGIPPYTETQRYVQRVALAYVLAGLLHSTRVVNPPSVAGSHARFFANSRRTSLPVELNTPISRRRSEKPALDVFAVLAQIRQARVLVSQRLAACPEQTGCIPRAPQGTAGSKGNRLSLSRPAGRVGAQMQETHN
jgi:hypothetical protein